MARLHKAGSPGWYVTAAEIRDEAARLKERRVRYGREDDIILVGSRECVRKSRQLLARRFADPMRPKLP